MESASDSPSSSWIPYILISVIVEGTHDNGLFIVISAQHYVRLHPFANVTSPGHARRRISVAYLELILFTHPESHAPPALFQALVQERGERERGAWRASWDGLEAGSCMRYAPEVAAGGRRRTDGNLSGSTRRRRGRRGKIWNRRTSYTAVRWSIVRISLYLALIRASNSCVSKYRNMRGFNSRVRRPQGKIRNSRTPCMVHLNRVDLVL
ncbi:hypothetical protein BC827DRAFT_247476 [Russula dissimulans]|nr:hypothetical protein BC827DRAFT_247476 [Russula dissimulans]